MKVAYDRELIYRIDKRVMHFDKTSSFAAVIVTGWSADLFMSCLVLMGARVT